MQREVGMKTDVVERYDYTTWNGMEVCTNGDYVLASDYDAKVAELEQISAELPRCEGETIIGAIRNLQHTALLNEGNVEDLEAQHKELLEASRKLALSAQDKGLGNPGHYQCRSCFKIARVYEPIHHTPTCPVGIVLGMTERMGR